MSPDYIPIIPSDCKDIHIHIDGKFVSVIWGNIVIHPCDWTTTPHGARTSKNTEEIVCGLNNWVRLVALGTE